MNQEYDEAIQKNVWQRIISYAGKSRNQVTNPHLTAREAIALADKIAELEYALDDIWFCANSGYNLEDLKAKIALYCEAPPANKHI